MSVQLADNPFRCKIPAYGIVLRAPSGQTFEFTQGRALIVAGNPSMCSGQMCSNENWTQKQSFANFTLIAGPKDQADRVLGLRKQSASRGILSGQVPDGAKVV